LIWIIGVLSDEYSLLATGCHCFFRTCARFFGSRVSILGQPPSTAHYPQMFSLFKNNGLQSML
ncbi:MAG: hypothetical protein L3J26_08475, partial [Candidatus Polarisedimenticolaceae bacterium]|nr:hypothetical protein [Candidatus Polarisedimenticolaceae bacterium]